jgi:hypothetical protein
MRQFYNITKSIKDTLEANSQVNVVTFGDIFDIDLNKQTIFPYPISWLTKQHLKVRLYG